MKQTFFPKYLGFVCAWLLLPWGAYAAHPESPVPGGVSATPTSYIVTVHKMEFLRSHDNTWVTFVEGPQTFDIATVAAGGIVGLFSSNLGLPAGTYTKMRATVSRTFNITASTSNAGSGQPARTNTGNAATGTQGSLTGIGLASTDGGTATPQDIPVPQGITFSGVEGVEEIGTTQLRMTDVLPTSFTIAPAEKTLPTIRLNFDLTGAVVFLTTGVGSAIIFPFGPQVIPIQVEDLEF